MNKIVDVLRFGLPYLRRYWFRLTAGVLLGVLFGLSSASFVWATRTIIDRMAPRSAQEVNPAVEVDSAEDSDLGSLRERVSSQLKKRSERWVNPWLPQAGQPVDGRQIVGGVLFLPLLVAIRGLVGFLSKYCMAWVGERSVNDMRNDVLHKLNTLSLDYFNRATMGDMITHVNTDTATIQKCLRTGVSDLIEQPMVVIGALIGMCWIDARLTLAALVLFPLCAIPVFILGKKARLAGRRARAVNVTQSSLLYEMLLGIRVVKAFGLEEHQENRFRQQSRQLVRQAMKAKTARELVAPIIDTVAMVGFGSLIVYVVYYNRPVADMVGFLTALVLFYNPIKKLAAIHVLFEQTSISIERMIRIIEEQPSVREPVQPRPLTGFRSEIRFESVSFSYGSELVLRDFNLSIPKGYRLGIAGESGSGKSTLVNLLFRFFDPTSGRITIDGVDLREVSGGDIRRLMAMVSQDVMLFDLSVRENIALGKPGGATHEEIEAAARAAFAHKFISALPEGYDTRVGERGVTLSGGQRQRVSIARAFIRNAPILVLDEATAALDSQSEAEVQAAIDRLAENRTVVSVAHRLSTLAQMDEIIVLSRGSLIERGSFAELVGRVGAFAAMARRQGIMAEGMAVK